MKGTDTMTDKSLELHGKNLEIVVPDIDQLSNEEYALARRQSFGASDSSVILGVLPYKSLDELIAEKQRDFITDDEKAIGDKVNVRKGRDLEPMILERASNVLGLKVLKPTAMYRIKEFPWLTVNFDGVFQLGEAFYPVECKYVSTYGDKYYNPKRAFLREFNEFHEPEQAWFNGDSDIKKHIEGMAEVVGIPGYYYTQVQQQILALEAPKGYLAALQDKSWELNIYAVPRDPKVIDAIKVDGWKAWQKVGR